MSKNLAQGIQPQVQAPSLVDLTEPPEDIDAPGEVVNKPQRSPSVKRSRSPGKTHIVSKQLLFVNSNFLEIPLSQKGLPMSD